MRSLFRLLAGVALLAAPALGVEAPKRLPEAPSSPSAPVPAPPVPKTASEIVPADPSEQAPAADQAAPNAGLDGARGSAPSRRGIFFLAQFLRNWKSIGAVAPSSSALADSMMVSAGVPSARHVLELGPGTGVFTAAIKRARPKDSRYLGIEMNKDFVGDLRGQFPGMHFEQADARHFDFAAYVKEHGRFDAIVSGLPWTAFPPSLQHEILDNVLPHLAENGRFVTFAYWGLNRLPDGRRFFSLLASRLPNVASSRVIWRNLPPAVVYTGSRPPVLK